MSDTTLIRCCSTKEEAHQAVIDGYAHAKTLLELDKRVKVSVGEDDDSLSARQRRFLHGAVLKQISEQARGEGGARHPLIVWKELFRAQFLGSTWSADPRGDRFPPIEVRLSTEDLGVKDYSDYIDKVIAEAVTVWNVAFRFRVDEREGARYVAPVRKPKQPGRGAAETRQQEETTA